MAAFTSPFLAALPAAARRELLDRAARVTASSEAWLREFPIVKRPSVTAACGLISAVALPGAGLAELDVLTRWWLWIFGVDDVFDDPAVPDERVAAWADRFVADVPADPGDGDRLRAALGSVHRDLARYPLHAPMADRWRAGMAGVVRGMQRERRWSAGGPPTFEEYLDTAMTTIAVRPYTVTACVLAGEPAAVAAFDALDPLIDAAARCFRLANDLRSEARERHEGTVNAVTLLSGGSAARDRLRAICLADLDRLDAARHAAPPALATLTRFLWAHTAFVWDMYQVGDYDTISTLLRS